MQPLPAGMPSLQQSKALPPDLATPVEILALPHVFSVVTAANLPALQACLQFNELWQEADILQRLHYKNKNQHRASKHLQSIAQVCKTLKWFSQLQLPELIHDLHAAAQRTSLPEAADPAAVPTRRSSKRHQQQPPASAGQQPNSNTSRQTVKLPTFQAGCCVLRRLLAGCQVMLRCCDIILTAAEHLSGQLSRGYFMPFCLVAVATFARLRVLAVNSILQLIQAYNNVMQLLPLLPVQAAHGAAANAPLQCTNNASGGGASSNVQQYHGVNIGDLPQLLKLTWQGPIPSLQCMPFEEADRIASTAAQLQETFCISWPAAAAAAGTAALPPGSAAVAAAAVSGDGQHVGIISSDFGESIGREEFERLLLQRQQQGSAAAAPSRPSVPEIQVFEDRHAAAPVSAAAGRAGAETTNRQGPLYSPAHGLGLGLGVGLRLGQQQQQQSQPPGLKLSEPPAVLAAATAVGDAAVGMQVDSSSMPADEQAEFEALYGTAAATAAPAAGPGQATTAAEALRAQPGPDAAANANEAARLPARNQPRGAVAVKPQCFGKSATAAAALAMQGRGSSSDSDEEMADAAAPAPAPIAATAGVSALAAADPSMQAPVPAAAAVNAPHSASAPTVVQRSGVLAVKQPALGASIAAALAMQGQGNSSDSGDEVADTRAFGVHSAAAAAVTPQQVGPGAAGQQVQAQQPMQQGIQQQTASMPAVEQPAADQTAMKPVTAQSPGPAVSAHVNAVAAAAAAAADATAEMLAFRLAAGGDSDMSRQQQQQQWQQGSEQKRQAMGDISGPAAATASVTPLLASKSAAKREAARQRQQKQQTQGAASDDWVVQLLISGTTTAVPTASTPGLPPTVPAATGVRSGRSDKNRGRGGEGGSKKSGSKQSSKSSAGDAGGSGSEGTGGRDPILDMLLGGL